MAIAQLCLFYCRTNCIGLVGPHSCAIAPHVESGVLFGNVINLRIQLD
jgi:hypothetical protein